MTVVTALVLAGYAAGWLVVAVWAARLLAGASSWAPVGMWEATLGASIALAWPLVLLPVLVRWLANHEPHRRHRLTAAAAQRMPRTAATS